MCAAETSFFSNHEIKSLGLRDVGRNVLISRKCSIYGGSSIQIGHNVRIDDFCILSGDIEIGSHVHVAAYSALFGGGGIIISDFANLSSRVSVYSISDDFSGSSLTNPTIPEKYKLIERDVVVLGRHTIVGSGTVVLPGTRAEEGAVVGALSLVKGRLEAWSKYAGIPARRIGSRSRGLLRAETAFLLDYANEPDSRS